MKNAKTMCVGIAAFFLLALVAVSSAVAVDVDPASVKLRNVEVETLYDNPLGADVAGIAEVGVAEYECMQLPWNPNGCRFSANGNRIQVVISQVCAEFDGTDNNWGRTIIRSVTLSGAPANLEFSDPTTWPPRFNPQQKSLPYQGAFTASRMFGDLPGDALPTCTTARPHPKGDPYVSQVNIFYTFEENATGRTTRVDKDGIYTAQ